ncbi:molybdopterin oxidoreductase [Halanaeroarchaeum sulfurireducens]|uniref:Molybdopterin oxidoreductase n=2 Tax=Halanaeroarchaeum sulfurireducens TaxID=1604004 RepID=A0A0N9MJ06_9EURY|nr:molybdopterin oxidoreductase [Halanaeroarchaeum sulfurireducens]
MARMTDKKNTDGSDSGIDRRTFLKTSAGAAAAAGVGSAGMAATQEASAQSDTEEGWTASGSCWDCHQLCGQRVKIQDGKATELKGVDGHPRGSAGEGRDGTLCSKGHAQIEKAYDPYRIKEPHVRKNGELKKVSWDEALQEAADLFREFKDEHGPEKLMLMHGYDTDDMWTKLLMNIYGSPNKVGHTTICHGPWSDTWAWMGGVGRPWGDNKNAEYIINWRRNEMESFNGQWQPKGILDAKEKNDATLVTIDPRYTKTAQHSDTWIPIEPRADGALALAMGNVIIEEGLYDEEFVDNWTYGFEEYRQAVADKTPEWAEDETGVDAETIRKTAIGFAEAAPNCHISIWTGITNAGNGHKTAQNIHALNGLVGNLDRPGGHRFFKATVDLADPYGEAGVEFPANHEDVPQVLSDYEEYPFHHVRGLSYTVLPEAVQNGDATGLFAYWANPLKNSATQEWFDALDELDMIVAIDAYWNGMTRRADVVLPESSQLEKPMFGAGGPGSYSQRGWVTGSKAAIEPQWNTKPGFDILKGLSQKMGYGNYVPWDSKEEKINDALSGMGLTLDELDEKSFVFGDEYGYESWKDGGFNTATGKFEFVLDNVEAYVKAAEQAGVSTAPEYIPAGEFGQEPDDEYPLEFTDTFVEQISRGGDQTLDHSKELLAERWGLEHKDYRGNYLLINPEDADPRGIEDGNMVTVESPAGSISLMAHVTEGIKPGYVTTSWGWGEGSITPDEEGGNSMMLHSADQIEPVIGMADRHIKVEVTNGGEQ